MKSLCHPEPFEWLRMNSAKGLGWLGELYVDMARGPHPRFFARLRTTEAPAGRLTAVR